MCEELQCMMQRALEEAHMHEEVQHATQKEMEEEHV
jgi:hypothetical protein